MKIIVSFFLSFFIVIILVSAFFYFITNKKNNEVKIVYIHNVITIKNTLKQKSKTTILNENKKIEIKKNIQKKIQKTNDNINRGGEDINFDDIFSNVSDNIKTDKLKIKKKKMTIENGDSKYRNDNFNLVKNSLTNLKTFSSFKTTKGKDSEKYISNEFAKVWGTIKTTAEEFVKIRIIIENGRIKVFVIATNLDKIRLDEFLNRLKQIDITKVNKFDGIAYFKAKLKE